MKLRLAGLVATALCSGALAQNSENRLDVVRWLDRCAELSDTHIADVMDLKCLALAYDYCEVGRLQEERQPCVLDLNKHLERQADGLVGRLPARIEGMSGFRLRSYERRLESLKSGNVHSECDRPADMACESIEISWQWFEARSLARDAGILKGRDPK